MMPDEVQVPLVDLERRLRRENLLLALQLAGAWSPASRARVERLAFEEFGEGCVVQGWPG